MIALSSSLLLLLKKYLSDQQDGNRNFLSSSSPQNIDFDSHQWMRASFSGSPGEKFQYIEYIHWRQKNSFNLPTWTLTAKSTSQYQEKLSIRDFSSRESECGEWRPGFFSHEEYCLSISISSYLVYEVTGMAEWLEEMGDTVSEAQSSSKSTDSTHCFTDSILLELYHLQTSYPPVLHASSTLKALSPAQVPAEVNASICRKFGSTHIKHLQLCGTGRRHTDLSISGYCPRKINWGFQYLAWLCRSSGKGTHFENCPQQGTGDAEQMPAEKSSE